MKLATFPQAFEETVRDLARALGRLELTQGRQARKNARVGVRRVLKRIANRMEAEYPVVKVEKEQPPHPVFSIGLSPAQRGALFKQKMTKRGYVPISVTDHALEVAILEGGVRLKRPPKRKTNVTETYAPAWAVVAARNTLGAGKYDVAKVREAKRSTTVRRALVAAARLNGTLPK